MSSVQCWKPPAFKRSPFLPNLPFHGEIVPIKSGESGILSMISTIALALLFTFYFLLRTWNFLPWSAVSRYLCSTTTPSRAKHAGLLHRGSVFPCLPPPPTPPRQPLRSFIAVFYSLLCLLLSTQHFFVFALNFLLCTLHFLLSLLGTRNFQLRTSFFPLPQLSSPSIADSAKITFRICRIFRHF